MCKSLEGKAKVIMPSGRFRIVKTDLREMSREWDEADWSCLEQDAAVDFCEHNTEALVS